MIEKVRLQENLSPVMRSDCKVMRKTVPQFFNTLLQLDCADPGLLMKINSAIPGKEINQKQECLQKVFSFFLFLRTNKPTEMNAPGQPN